MSAISTAISNYLRRRTAERVETEEPEQDLADVTTNANRDNDEEEGEYNDSEISTTEISSRATTEDISSSSLSTATPIIAAEDETIDDERYRNFTLNDLKRERDRTDTIVLLSSYGWIIAWVVTFSTGNPFMFLFSLILSSWYFRFVDERKEKVDTLNDLIHNWNDDERDNNGGLLTTENTIVIDPAQLRRLSMRSQMAIAIAQSQLQALDNDGFDDWYLGNNGSKSKVKKSVKDEAKKQWDIFKFHSKKDLVLNDEIDNDDDEVEEEQDCSICLCEYEKGERLVSLPCKHIFHEDCITAWTDRHTTCPLCNTDLNASVETTPTTIAVITGDEIV